MYCFALSPSFLLILFLFLNKEMPSPPASGVVLSTKEVCRDPCGDTLSPAQLKQGLSIRQQQEAAALHPGLFLAASGGLYQMSPCPLPGAAGEHCSFTPTGRRRSAGGCTSSEHLSLTGCSKHTLASWEPHFLRFPHSARSWGDGNQAS